MQLTKADRLYVQMESQDMWLHVTLRMNNLSEDSTVKSDFQIKIDGSMTGGHLKRVMQKLSISIWNRVNSDSNKTDKDDENGCSLEQTMDFRPGHSQNS